MSPKLNHQSRWGRKSVPVTLGIKKVIGAAEDTKGVSVYQS